jgi:hypothetical protein
MSGSPSQRVEVVTASPGVLNRLRYGAEVDLYLRAK